MAITPSDFNVIWGTNATTPAYTFSDADYQVGWDIVGNLPPTRAQWNAIQKKTDEKMQYLAQNFGHPFTAAVAADMTDTDKVYVYVGSEAGYTTGDWYYYDEGTSSWVSGGAYNATALVTDATLSISGEAADAKATGDAINKVDTEMSLFGVDDLLWEYTADGSSRTHAGITYTVDKDAKTVTLSNSTATGTSFYRFYYNSSALPSGMVTGGKYVAEINTDMPCDLQIFYYDSNGTLINSPLLANTTKQQEFTVPADARGLLIRLQVANGNTVGGVVRPLISKAYSLNGLMNAGFVLHGILPTNTDLNDVKAGGYYYLNAPNTYSNAPINSARGILKSYFVNANFGLQEVTYCSPSYMRYKRIYRSGWDNWVIDDNNVDVLPNSDLNDLQNGGSYLLTQDGTYANAPEAGVSFLLQVFYSYRTVANITQVAYGFTTNKKIYRRSKTGSNPWRDWEVLGQDNYVSLPSSTDLNDVTENSVWLLVSNNGYLNSPTNKAGMLEVYNFNNGNHIFQLIYGYQEEDKIYRRTRNLSHVWNDWEEIGGGGGGTTYNNTYEFNEYTSTNTYTVTPTITTDNHNYLASSGDSTDRKGDIETLLSTNGICHLAPGDFYVSGIDMPDNSTLLGCGNTTRVILIGSDTDEGYAVKMGGYCNVQNMTIMGSTADNTSNGAIFNINSVYVQRHGILWQGNRSGDNDDIPQRGTINNCYICNFSGGGITGYDTGGTVSSGLNVSDCTIWYCYAGINLIYWTEFNRFVNVTSNNCLYGCVDNGGNNYFSNCSFSNNRVGLLMDNSNGQSPNHSHGTFSACSFHHSGSNVGYGIKMYGMTVGEIFTGCQIGFSKTLIDGCNGIRFVGCNILSQTDIEISNSSAVTYDSCQFRLATDTPVSVTNSQGIYFNNCYLRSGSVFNPVG